jgi:hypothetical protein
VFPTVNVQNRSDKYFTYDRAFWFKSDAQLRGPSSESAGSGYEVGTDDFSCDVYAVHRNLSDQVRANADSPITMDRDATEFVTEHMLQRREQAWVARYFTTNVWGTDRVGGTDFTQWDDYANSDPIRDMRDGVIAMAKLTAKKPNTMILGAEVWDILQDHPDYLDRIKWTQKGVVSEDLISSLIGVKKTYVAWSIKNTAPEGVTASYDFNLGKNCLLMYVAPSPGLNTVSAGYTFNWSGLFGTGKNGIRIKRFRMEWIESDRVEAEEAIDQKVVSSELGQFYSAAVS